MTKYSVEEVSPIERRINVEVAPDQVSTQLELAYRMLSHRVKIPGFRPGKVPRRILEARFKDQVESDVIQALVETTYREALQGNPGVLPVAPPRVSNEGLKPGEPFRYQAHVEVKPKVDPKNYDGLALKKDSSEVTDAQVEEEINRIRESMAQLVDIQDRVNAQEGDFAVVDFEGTADGQVFPGGKGEDATIELIQGEVADGNMPAMIGAAVGETREFDYTFPGDYRAPELAGKAAHFKATLKSLKSKKLPALDDSLAKEVGAGDTLDELRKRIREEMVSRATEKAERERREEVVKQLIERNPFDVPQGMVDRAVEGMIEGALGRMARQGVDPRNMQLDFERLRGSLREPAVVEVKGALLLEAIADKENIQVTDADIDAKVKDFAEKLKAPEDKVRAHLLGPEESRGLRFRIREEKTLAFLASKANIAQS